MHFQHSVGAAVLACLWTFCVASSTGAQQTTASRAAAQGQKVTVSGIVRDERHAILLPGVPVEVVSKDQIVYTDVDGRYVVEVAPGVIDLKVQLDGYQERVVRVNTSAGQSVTVDVTLIMDSFAEEVTVSAEVVAASTSTAEAQLSERNNAPVITDNMGSQEMRRNGDSDAAAAMSRVTGLSVVDNQYVFVRGLGERYSNTTMSGSVIPTTEPDKKVVPLDLFPAALIDSVQVAKTYSVDKSAEFAGGLVQIVPLKFSRTLMFDAGVGLDYFSNATGKNIVLSPLGNDDFWGYDDGARALPGGFPADKIVRRGIYTPDVGYSRDEIAQFGRLLENRWSPATERGAWGPNWALAFGNRFDKLSVIASARHSYKEEFTEENRKFYVLGGDGDLEAQTDYDIQTGVQKAQVGLVGNVAYQFSTNHRLGFDNFYTHTGRDEGRSFVGPNEDSGLIYRNSRVQFIEEGLYTAAANGDHFFEHLAGSRIDWRASWGVASRDEPDLRETLYQGSSPTGTFRLADESQSGFRMFNALNDKTADVQLNWIMFTTLAGPLFSNSARRSCAARATSSRAGFASSRPTRSRST